MSDNFHRDRRLGIRRTQGQATGKGQEDKGQDKDKSNKDAGRDRSLDDRTTYLNKPSQPQLTRILHYCMMPITYRKDRLLIVVRSHGQSISLSTDRRNRGKANTA